MDINNLQVGDLIPIGGSGNVKPNEVLEGKTFSSDDGVDLIGSMKNYGNKIVTPSKDIQILSKGYYDSVKINPIEQNVLQNNFPELKPENIKNGVGVGGIVGSAKIIKELTGVFHVNGKTFSNIPSLEKEYKITIPENFELNGYIFVATLIFNDSLYSHGEPTVKYLQSGNTDINEWKSEFTSNSIQFIHESTKYTINVRRYEKYQQVIRIDVTANNNSFLQHMNIEIDYKLIIF